ncbi:MAG: hypothetical protein NC253_01320 [Ruminococcus sp.]|nr:hypothetical protein [Ruminococcus sp.]MCM1380935.1 hypothetical protein [Muribaculaceae bacterium]MCM1480959.1 hypothetical protein [Muribaculaceae bacterium]
MDGGGGNVYYVDVDTRKIESLLGDIIEHNNENYEIIINDLTVITENQAEIITDLNIISDTQSSILVSNMLMCGLLGLIIGICFVNIFKGR